VKPKIYEAKAHHIDKEGVDHDALYVIERLQQQGYSAYLVGGGVRDLLAEQTPKDFDVSTDAKPEEIKKLFGRQCLLIGRRFRLAHIRFGKKVIEVSTFRAFEQQVEGELILNDNVFGSPEEDALRRDFTINGLFYNPHDETVIDYVGGFEDLQKGVLSTIGDPLVRFKEDPVRMIRLLKFNARFNYEIDSPSMSALEALKDEITKSAQARILEELLRMLESGFAEPFFRKMSEKGLLEPIAPLLALFLEGDHGEEIYSYLIASDKIIKRFGKRALDRPLLTCCLIYPVLERRLSALAKESEKPLHLGQVMIETHNIIRDLVTTSFSRFPKRLSTIMSLVLVNQFRLTPLGKKPSSSQKFLQSRDFPEALKFLKIRSLVNEKLKEPYHIWKEKYKNVPHGGDRQPHPHTYHTDDSRRRRRRSRSR
jgi:poly(A) polymerase